MKIVKINSAAARKVVENEGNRVVQDALGVGVGSGGMGCEVCVALPNLGTRPPPSFPHCCTYYTLVCGGGRGWFGMVTIVCCMRDW